MFEHMHTYMQEQIPPQHTLHLIELDPHIWDRISHNAVWHTEDKWTKYIKKEEQEEKEKMENCKECKTILETVMILLKDEISLPEFSLQSLNIQLNRWKIPLLIPP